MELISRRGALGGALAAGCAAAAMRCPAIRPATRTPMPRARPMFRGYIPIMMVAVAYALVGFRRRARRETRVALEPEWK